MAGRKRLGNKDSSLPAVANSAASGFAFLCGIAGVNAEPAEVTSINDLDEDQAAEAQGTDLRAAAISRKAGSYDYFERA